MLKEQINSFKALKTKLMQRITELEEDLRCTKEEAEKMAKNNKSDDEVSIRSLVFTQQGSRPFADDDLLVVIVTNKKDYCFPSASLILSQKQP